MLIVAGCLVLIASAITFQVNISSPNSHFYKTRQFSPEQLHHNQSVGLSVSVILFREVTAEMPIGWAVALMLVGGGLLLAGLRLSRSQEPWLQTANHPFVLPLPRWNTLFLLTGVLFLWVVAEANGQVLNLTLLNGMNHHVQFILLCLGIGLVTAGMGNRFSRDFPPMNEKATRGEGLALLAVTLLAFLLRVWGLDTTIRVLVDEVHYTSAAVAFWKQNVNIISPMTRISPFPWLYAYSVAGTTELFGHNFYGARLPSAIFGTLTIPALYLLAKTLFDRKTALIAALLLATFPPHLHFSRLSMLHVCDALSGTLALAFIARGLKHSRRMDYALGGAALGMTQYFYEGGRLVFPAIVLLWMASGLIFWEKRPNWRGILIIFATAVLIAAPVYYAIAGGGTAASGRLNTVGVGGSYLKRVLLSSPGDEVFEAQFDRLKQSFLVFVSIPDASIFYAGNTPLLLVYLVPLFLIGLTYLLWRWRTPACWLLLLGLALPPLGTSLLVESGISVRFVAIFPLLLLPVAIALRYVTPYVLPLPESSHGRVILTAAICLAGVQTAYYFRPHLEAFNQQFRIIKPYPDGEDALWRSLDFPNGTKIYLISDPRFPQFYTNEVLQYFDPELTTQNLKPEEITPNFAALLPCDRTYHFFIAPASVDVVDRLKTHLDLSPPSRSPYADDIPDVRELLYYTGGCRQ